MRWKGGDAWILATDAHYPISVIILKVSEAEEARLKEEGTEIDKERHECEEELAQLRKELRYNCSQLFD